MFRLPKLLYFPMCGYVPSLTYMLVPFQAGRYCWFCIPISKS